MAQGFVKIYIYIHIAFYTAYRGNMAGSGMATPAAGYRKERRTEERWLGREREREKESPRGRVFKQSASCFAFNPEILEETQFPFVNKT